VNIQLTLIGKPGCHLCDDAKLAVDEVIAAFSAAYPAAEIGLTEQNILLDHDLAIKYSDEIPVLLIDGKVHNYWRIDKERLRSALDARVSKPGYLKNERCV
jgi:glutaredoxin